MQPPKFAIGIPSYNEVESISFVLKQVDAGIRQYFNPSEFIILNLDSDSTDGTKEAFLNTNTVCSKRYFEAPPGKGRAMLNFFKYCLDNQIPYIATVDADLKSIKPNWIVKLLKPIVEGFDFVIPVYSRNRFEANITNHFAYPLILANYGAELRQPLGGEFGYSSGFCRFLLDQPKYLKTYEYGIDIFISCNAVFGGFNIKETYLSQKIHAPSFYHMEPTFRQVSESGIFVTKFHRNRKFDIGKITRSGKSSGIGSYKYFPHKKAIPRLKKQLKRRFIRYRNERLYERFIVNKSLIRKIASIIDGEDLKSLDSNLWSDYLAALLTTCYYRGFDIRNLKIISRISIPIYRWRAMTYWLAVENASPEKAEKVLKEQAFLLKTKMKRYN